jgi:hypothetical protein
MPRHHCLPRRQLVVIPASKGRLTMPRHHHLPRCRLVVAPASKGRPIMPKHRRPPRRQLVIAPASKGWPTMPKHRRPPHRQVVIAPASKGQPTMLRHHRLPRLHGKRLICSFSVLCLPQNKHVNNKLDNGAPTTKISQCPFADPTYQSRCLIFSYCPFFGIHMDDLRQMQIE